MSVVSSGEDWSFPVMLLTQNPQENGNEPDFVALRKHLDLKFFLICRNQQNFTRGHLSMLLTLFEL